MIATWMLYCALCALGLSLAAVLAERVLLAARGPVRFVWVCAVALSVIVPIAAYRFAPRAAPQIATPVADVAPDSIVDATVSSGATAPLSRPAEHAATRSWRTAVAAADAPLSVAWVTLSAVLFAHFVCGVVALAWMRRWWRRDTVLGVDVLVSEATGPALVGAVSPAIVVPEWTLSMDAGHVALMLRHEEEHRRAHDGQLLTAAQLALIVMPWNPALWWQLLRLRVAVELDCDARVLRDADARSYGDLLLEVARPRRRLMLLGATAFAERASQLERRIRAIGMRRGVSARGVRAFAASIGVAAVSLAWVAPRPAVPPLPTHAAPAASPAPRPSDSLAPTHADSSAASRSLVAKVLGTESQSPVGPPTTATRDSTLTKGAVVRDPIQVPPIPPIRDGVFLPTAAQPAPPPAARATDSVFERLFGGIALTPEQEVAARAQILRLQLAQQAQMAAFVQALTQSLPLRMAIQAQADSALLGLLANEDDRSVVRSRLVAQVPGGRGRSGGPGTPLGGGRGVFVGDTLIGSGGRADVPLQAPAAGAGRGARVGGAGRGAAGLVDPVDAMISRLFNGVALSPEQESGARTIIAKMQADLRELGPTPQPTIIAVRPFANQIVMSPESAATLTAILTNDGDRATLQSRIVIEIVRTPSTNPPR